MSTQPMAANFISQGTQDCGDPCGRLKVDTSRPQRELESPTKVGSLCESSESWCLRRPLCCLAMFALIKPIA